MTAGGRRVVLVAAVARNGVIGNGPDIPWRIPGEQAEFKRLTMGHTLVMGRTTYDSIGRPLPGRTTIVLTRDPGWTAEGVLVAHSVDDALEQAGALPGDVMVVGGAEVYAAAMPHATEQVISEVPLEPAGDVLYPSFDAADWREVRREVHEGYERVFLERISPGRRPRVARMDLRIMTEPQQGATYDDLLAVARTTEELGFSAFFRSDHFLRIGEGDAGPGPTDAWVTLAGLARDTSTIRLGTMVTSATFRRPGPLAVAVATVDQMSGGRVELGIGTGWYAAEHEAFGVPFPEVGERFEVLEEQLEIITGLWDTPEGSTFSHTGRHYTLSDNPGLPKPVRRPPVILGGHGPRRTPALAARFADEFNIPFSDVETARAQYDRVRAACEAAERDPGSITMSKALVLCVGRDDAEYRRRLGAIGHDDEQIRRGQAAGTVQQVVDRLGEYAGLGVTRVYLQVLDLSDLDHLRLVAEEVAPAVR